jgi:hypothetical protein
MQVDWALRSFIKTNAASQNMTDIIPGCHELIDFKCTFKNSLIIHEENTKKNHKRVVSLYVDKDFPSFT